MASERLRSRSRSPLEKTASASSSSHAPASQVGLQWRSPLRRSCWRALRSSLEEVYGVDSWNLRAEPALGADIVGVLYIGGAFQCLGETEDGQWLKVHMKEMEASQSIAYAARFYHDRDSGESIEAFVPSGVPELCEHPRPRQKPHPLERRDALLQNLSSLRHHYEQLAVGQRDVVRVQTSRKIESLMRELDTLGVPYNDVLSSSDPMTMLLRGSSFQHRDFVNPDAETCWLSCLFQSLWHSVVFHAAFELYLAPSKCTPGPEEKVLTALQRTWCSYTAEVHEEFDVDADTLDMDADMLDSIDPPRLVPTNDLVEGFGKGYGDMAEAFGSMQDEFSKSANPAAKKISDLIMLIPLVFDGSWPKPGGAWNMAVELLKPIEAVEVPLLAVDLSLPELSVNSNRTLAQLWIPKEGSRANRIDFGSSHRIVALVCYMWHLRHYVTFCRRQRDNDKCLFFNDLPGLIRDAPKEMAWKTVPDMCYQHNLAPRLVLYESVGAAEEVVRKLPKRESTAGCSTQ